jgi:hypothetical protein
LLSTAGAKEYEVNRPLGVCKLGDTGYARYSGNQYSGKLTLPINEKGNAAKYYEVNFSVIGGGCCRALALLWGQNWCILGRRQMKYITSPQVTLPPAMLSGNVTTLLSKRYFKYHLHFVE